MDIFSFLIIGAVISLIILIRKFMDSTTEDKRFALVEAKIKAGDHISAIKYLEDLRKREPKNIEIYQYLVSLYEKKKMYVRAVKCYDKLLEYNHPDNEQNKLLISYRLSKIYKKLGLYDKYFLENKKIIEIDPNDKKALYDIGYFLAGIGQYDKAVEILEKLIKIEPDHVDALLILGISYLSKKWFKEGKETLEKITQQTPDVAQAWFFLGYVLKEYRSPEAIKVFEEAISKIEDEKYIFMATIASAITSIQLNMIDVAINTLNNRLSFLEIEDERRKDFLFNLGWAYFFKGDIEAALSNWEEVANIDMNYFNISEIMSSNMNSNFEEMEREYNIYAKNITYPTAKEYINFTKDYNITELEQTLALWKQKMVTLAKARGVYMGPVKSAKVFSTLTRIKFKNIAHKLVGALGYVVERESIYADGVDFLCYRRNANKKEKVFVRVKNWNDVISEERIAYMVRDMKNEATKPKTNMLIVCGKFSKKAKSNAEKYNIKLYDERIVTSMLTKIVDLRG